MHAKNQLRLWVVYLVKIIEKQCVISSTQSLKADTTKFVRCFGRRTDLTTRRQPHNNSFLQLIASPRHEMSTFKSAIYSNPQLFIQKTEITKIKWRTYSETVQIFWSADTEYSDCPYGLTSLKKPINGELSKEGCSAQQTINWTYDPWTHILCRCMLTEDSVGFGKWNNGHSNHAWA